MGRDENRDLMDFRFLLEKMDEKGENFRDLGLALDNGEEMKNIIKILTAAGKAEGKDCYDLLKKML